MAIRKESNYFQVYQLNSNLYGLYFKPTGEEVGRLFVYPNMPTLMAAEMLSDIVEVYDRYAKALKS